MTRSAPVIERLEAALNQKDLDAVLDCFTDAFRCEQPVYLGRPSFGKNYVKVTWENVFHLSSDFAVDLLSSTTDGETIWAEWIWHDVPTGSAFIDVRGVTIFGVEDDRLNWCRMYLEPVRETEECFMLTPERASEITN